MVADSPVLLARLRELHEQREIALAEVLAEESGTDPGDITPRAVAAQLTGALRCLFDHTLQHGIDDRSLDDTAALATEAAKRTFDLLEPALSDYATRSGSVR